MQSQVIDFDKTALQIAQELSFLDKGSSWEINPERGHSSYICLVNKANETEGICINHRDRENRFDISADWPCDENHRSLRPSPPYDHKGAWFAFGCSSTKAPVVVAKEIMRRLMAEYREKLAEVLNVERLRIEAEERRLSLAKAISAILEIPFREDRKCHGYPQVRLPHDFCPGIDSLEIECAEEDDIRIKFESSSLLLAMNVLAEIKKHIVNNRNPPKRGVAETWAELKARNIPQGALVEYALNHWEADAMGDCSIMNEQEIIDAFSKSLLEVEHA